MTVLIIDTDNKKDLVKAKTIARENGWVLKQKKQQNNPPESNNKMLIQLFREFASKGGPVSFPKNASAWQRRIRKDKKLTGR